MQQQVVLFVDLLQNLVIDLKLMLIIQNLLMIMMVASIALALEVA